MSIVFIFAFYLPFFGLQMHRNPGKEAQLFFSLFSPVAMGLGAQTIMNWEIMSVGIQWSNVGNYTSPSAGPGLICHG